MRRFYSCIFVLFIFASCKLYFRQNNQLQIDRNELSSHDFANKYYALYNGPDPDSLGIGSTFKSYRGLEDIKYIHLGKDWFIYESSFFLEGEYSSIGLRKSGYYQVSDSLIKMEYIAQNPGSVYGQIFEGFFNERGIELIKKYNSGALFKRKMFEQYHTASNVEISKVSPEFLMINLLEEE